MNKLSDFEPFEEIGRGKLTVVYRGHQISLDRQVAIKCLEESAKTDPRKLEWFVRQARFLANFSHPHLVPVVSVDEQQGWLVMELMQGSLESCVNGNDLLSANDARTVIKQALDALEYIHGRGYLHGLIRPSNILIDSTEGVAKLGDFEEIDLKSGIASRSKDFKYLAPELLDSNQFGPIGVQLDLYNLGFSIFESMVGSDAARKIVGIGDAAEIETAWMRWHQSPESYPPMKQVIPNIPNDLAQFLDTTLKKNVSERPPTADEATKIVDNTNVSDSISATLVEHLKISESDTSQSSSGHTGADTLQTQRELLPGGHQTGSNTLKPSLPASATVQNHTGTKGRQTSHSTGTNPKQAKSPSGRKNWQGSSNKSNGKSLSLNDKRVFYPIAGVVLVLAAIIGFMLQGENESDTELSVIIKTQLEDVQFYIGDEKVDTKPSKKLDGAYVMQLEKGKVELTARKQGYKDFTKEIDVSESEHIFEFKLTQLKKLVEIATNPADAMIKLDGKELEPGENGKFAFPVGDYQLSFAADGYQDKTVDLSVIDGENEPVVVALKRNAVMVSIQVTPGDSVIAWNDTEHQVTNGMVEIQMPIGQHLIEISRDGCATMTESIEVTLEETAGFEFELPMVVQSKLTPADAEVWINGELAEADLINSDTYHLKSGTYNIELKKDGFKSLAMELSVGPDKENMISGALTKMAQTTPPENNDPTNETKPGEAITARTFNVEIPDNTTPKGELVFRGNDLSVNNGSVDIPLVLLDGIDGKLEITLRLPDGKSFRQEFESEFFESDDSSIISFRAKPKPIQPVVTKADEARYLWMYARAGVKSSGNAEFAERQLTRAIELDETLWQAYRDRGIARFTQGKTELARRDFEMAVEKLPSEAHGFSLLQQYSTLLLLVNKPQQSVEKSEMALDRRDHATGPQVIRANTFFHLQQYGQAKDAVDYLLKNTHDADQASFGFNLLGLIYKNQGDEAKAIVQFRTAINIYKKNAAPYLNLAKSAREYAILQTEPERRQQFLLEAQNAYKTCIKTDTAYAEKALPVAAQIEVDLGNLQTAINIFSELIERFGPTRQRYLNRANLYERLGNNEQATRDRVRAEDLN